ncbi:MAG: replication initiation protein [Suipraeoptans sp.]
MADIGELEKERNMIIAKSNDMIRKSRYNLSTVEQKIVMYLFSKIKPEDTDLTEYCFEIKNFCDVCGIDYNNGGNYKHVKAVIKGLRDKSFWIEEEDGTESLCSWIRKASVNKGTGKGIMKLDETILKHAIGLIQKGNFTQFMMIYTLPMKGQYSRHFYEILKSRENEINKYNKEFVVYEVTELQRILMADNYKKYNDFKKYVLNYALEEINEYSDLQVSFEEIRIKTGKRGNQPIGSLKFFIKSRDVFDISITRQVNNNIMNEQAKIKEI